MHSALDTLLAGFAMVVMLIFERERWKPSCLHCGGRRWHGRNCPERDR